MSELKQEPNSICSAKMENSAQDDEVLALGRKLVTELGLDDTTDTLGRWMAHYIADRIAKLENASVENKAGAQKECFETIMALWQHRSELPNGKRPFEELEPVIRAVESLDPDNDIPRYFRTSRPPKSKEAESSEQEQWLKLVEHLDYSAKALIGFALAEAASAAVDKSKEWVKLAEKLGGDDGVPEIIIRFVSTAEEANREPDLDGERRRRLEGKIKHLRAFMTIAEQIVDTLAARLEALPSPKSVEGEGELRLVTRPAIPDRTPGK